MAGFNARRLPNTSFKGTPLRTGASDVLKEDVSLEDALTAGAGTRRMVERRWARN